MSYSPYLGSLATYGQGPEHLFFKQRQSQAPNQTQAPTGAYDTAMRTLGNIAAGGTSDGGGNDPSVGGLPTGSPMGPGPMGFDSMGEGLGAPQTGNVSLGDLAPDMGTVANSIGQAVGNLAGPAGAVAGGIGGGMLGGQSMGRAGGQAIGATIGSLVAGPIGGLIAGWAGGKLGDALSGGRGGTSGEPDSNPGQTEGEADEARSLDSLNAAELAGFNSDQAAAAAAAAEVTAAANAAAAAASEAVATGDSPGPDSGGDVGGFGGSDSGGFSDSSDTSGATSGGFSDSSDTSGATGGSEGSSGGGTSDSSGGPSDNGSGGSGFARGGQVEMSEGGFVIPADVVSGLGDGSTKAGYRRLGLGQLLEGPGTGMSDDIPANIDGEAPAAVADGEVYLSPKEVALVGGGRHADGVKRLYALMDQVRKHRHGTTEQPKPLALGDM